MPLRFYNSLKKQKQPFEPLEPGRVGMYVCGPTVYDEPHLGHLRSAYVFDVIRRWFSFSGYAVRFVRNVTDVDDKIIEKAAKSKPADLVAETREVSARYYDMYRNDLDRLGILAPDVEPRATEHIGEMIAIIEGLILKGLAYPSGGDVYFEVRKFSSYGQLSHQDIESIIENVRLEKNEKKRDTLDFALWKSAKPGEPSWPSPWGDGRPGWHIECSAMSKKHLAESFDIHGGGRDLIFPHHENETAQSEGLSGKPLARYWIHHGLITVDQVKMSKSLKNFVTLAEFGKRIPASESVTDVLKLVFLSTHYEAALDFTEEKLAMERAVWRRFFHFFQEAHDLAKAGVAPDTASVAGFDEPFRNCMDNDFNTPEAITAMQTLMKQARKTNDPAKIVAAAAKLRELAGKAFNLFSDFDAIVRKEEESNRAIQGVIEDAIRCRAAAKAAKDFGAADGIREGVLRDHGVELIDLLGGRTIGRLKV